MQTIRIIATNTFSQIIGKTVSVIATLLVTLLVARQLGAAGYGDFIKITTYIAFFYLLVDFGMNAIFQQEAQKNNSWPALLIVRTIVGIICMLCSLFILFIIPTGTLQGYTSVVRLGILLYSPTILLQAWIVSGNAVFQKSLQYYFSTLAIFFGSITMIGVLCMLYFLWNITSVNAPIIALGLGSFITAAVSLLLAFRLQKTLSWHVSLEDILRLILPSIPLGITLLFNLVYFRADSIIITLTRSTIEVGIYGLAYKIFEVVLVFPTFYMNTVYPLMVQNRNNIRKIFSSSIFFLLVTSLVTTLIVWVTAPFITLIKSDFSSSIVSLRILSLGFPFFFLTSATMWLLIALRKQTLLMWIYGLSMVVNVLGNILLVPTHGYVASAWLTVACEGLVFVLSILYSYRYV